jgi:surface antigen
MNAKNGWTHFFLALALVSLILSACQQLPGTRQEQGTVIGGAAGAVVGHEIGDSTLGTVIGAVAGGVLGNVIGRRMDERDRQNLAQALSENETRTWTNPQTNANYRVDPTDTVRRNGQLCREYEMTANVEGQPREAEGLACQQPDGSWRVVN